MLQNLVRLAQYGLHCISGSRRDLEYCIYSSWYLPPERFLQAEIKNGFICRAGDIWSFGIAVLELSIVGHFLSIQLKFMRSMFCCCYCYLKTTLATVMLLIE